MLVHTFFYFSIALKIINALRMSVFTSYINSLNTFPNKNKLRRKYMNRLKLVDESIKNNEHIIKLTDNAERKIKELVKEKEEDFLILKLFVQNGGCKGLQYKLNPIKKDEIEDDDYIQQFENLRFILSIDSTSVIYVFNNTLDYNNDLINGGFKFINPNATKKCGCGKSFNI
ncbi:iron-sulfur assembly protein, putative [Plasmodium gallinaceum]|uniref:Iron-sulfur assembly protein, putative n=1 Tax=Plasmodium gallinaceum TaxID=5849 RepID=A0A1J1GKZ7_PLAGA|nr:iron-sulfur assembly protein, putative [Plasmodium gallinaceum]CRG92995.1 iron-sulfur assembly protein, putative [Plasmodium gallinaceum]